MKNIKSISFIALILCPKHSINSQNNPSHTIHSTHYQNRPSYYTNQKIEEILNALFPIKNIELLKEEAIARISSHAFIRHHEFIIHHPDFIRHNPQNKVYYDYCGYKKIKDAFKIYRLSLINQSSIAELLIKNELKKKQ